MGKNIYTFFNIEKAEKLSVQLFLIQSVFIGIFFGAFDVGAHSLFLKVYPASMIPKAYVLSGIVGIVLTTIYARFQIKYKFSKLAFGNLLFISLVTAVLRVLFEYTENSWLIFLIFIMMGPLNIIALLSFWGAVGRIFTLRQGKRLFGLIDTGQIIGAILSTIAIPVLISIGFQQKNLLFLSSVSIGCALIIQIIISLKYNLNKKQKNIVKKQRHLPELLKNKYILHMAIFVVMSMLAAFFIQYSFLSVTKENYPDNDNLTEFLGAFTASLLLFTLLFKTFVYSKLMKAYGLKISIILSSFLLGIFTLIAIFIGSLYGFSSISTGFIFFFLIISLSRLFSKALKDGVEVPSFKILYQSLKEDIRHDVQAYIDGTINEIAALAAGLILAALSFFEFFTLIHFSYTLIIVLAIWFFVARKLYNEYKASLQKSLAEYKKQKEKVKNIVEYTQENKAKNINQAYEYLSLLHPIIFNKLLPNLIKNQKDNTHSFVQHNILNSYSIENFQYVEKQSLIQGNNLLNIYKEKNAYIHKSPGKEMLVQLSKSKSTDDKIWAAYLIGKYYEKSLFIPLKSLLRDLQIPVKKAAIKAIVKTKDKEFCSVLTDYIDTKELIPYIYDALLNIAEPALVIIDQHFYKTAVNHRTQLRIVKLIGQIGGNKAKQLLIQKLQHPNEEILKQVLYALQETGFKAGEKETNQIHQIIENHIGVMAWNMAAKSTLIETEGLFYLKEAFEEELKSNYNLLYLLLSLAYDAKSIMNVKENIESGTTEGISYALELLDLFIAEDIKTKLFPVIEDISYAEKIRQLQNFYPVEKLNVHKLLIAIINRDMNNISIWTKACAIDAFEEKNTDDIPDDLIAQVFNPFDILNETAINIIYKLDENKFSSLKNRLKQTSNEQYHKIEEYIPCSKKDLLTDKIKELKKIQYFSNTEGRYLHELAKVTQALKSNFYGNKSFLVSYLKNKVLFTNKNNIKIKMENQDTLELFNGELYDINSIIPGNVKEISIDKEDINSIFYIPKNELIYNMFDFQSIEIAILNWFDKNK